MAAEAEWNVKVDGSDLEDSEAASLDSDVGLLRLMPFSLAK